ncbi:MAG: dipeptidase, partial [Acidobacteriota bacterium]|nr:dipeptidase [Acidobacteriota bacterium]
DVETKAARLAREILIVDTHVDVPYRLHDKMEDISQRTENGHFDYPRAVAGGLNVPFMSIYVPASYENEGAKAHADELIDMVIQFESDWPDKFAVARSTSDIEEQFDRGVISLPMGMENGAPLEGDLDNLAYFYDRGIRYITLTHSENNHICDSSYADEKKWNGLSEFGREVVAEMNRLGIMIDVSHVSDDTFYQVIELSAAPVIASHSSCRAFTPGWERNMDDDMIVALAEHGGVLQINFGSAFLLEEAQKQSKEFWGEYRGFLEANGIESADERAKAFRDEYWTDHERITGDVSDAVTHINHVVELVGVDHVGFGSDFDGVFTVPKGLDDVEHFPVLIAALLEEGYSEEEIRKIAGGNLMRVWSEVERVARALQTGA